MHIFNSDVAHRMEEEAAFKAFAAQPNLHEQIFSKVAPNIFGHADIKKAVACLLFGGARKVYVRRNFSCFSQTISPIAYVMTGSAHELIKFSQSMMW